MENTSARERTSAPPTPTMSASATAVTKLMIGLKMYAVNSAFVREMRALGVRPTGFSKYCIGVSMLYPEVKHNRFKPQLRRIDQLLH